MQNLLRHPVLLPRVRTRAFQPLCIHPRVHAKVDVRGQPGLPLDEAAQRVSLLLRWGHLAWKSGITVLLQSCWNVNPRDGAVAHLRFCCGKRLELRAQAAQHHGVRGVEHGVVIVLRGRGGQVVVNQPAPDLGRGGEGLGDGLEGLEDVIGLEDPDEIPGPLDRDRLAHGTQLKEHTLPGQEKPLSLELEGVVLPRHSLGDELELRIHLGQGNPQHRRIPIRTVLLIRTHTIPQGEGLPVETSHDRKD
mmetsp:Transcript_119922/g.208788  ORF Transcript_119922/g.208788 Transcript_119922/m.208788 type:complete len:248 (-) Transcript_119922:70-813(-)